MVKRVETVEGRPSWDEEERGARRRAGAVGWMMAVSLSVFGIVAWIVVHPWDREAHASDISTAVPETIRLRVGRIDVERFETADAVCYVATTPWTSDAAGISCVPRSGAR